MQDNVLYIKKTTRRAVIATDLNNGFIAKEPKIDSLNWTLENKANDFLKDPCQVVVVWRGFLDTGRYSEGDWYVLNAVGEDEYEWQETDDVTHFAIAIKPLGGSQ